MSEKYVVTLDRSFDKKEDFEIEDKNLIQVEVQLPTQEIIKNKAYKVILKLSNEAKLGLGKELIRSALVEKRKEEFIHVRSIESGLATEYLGIYLHSHSCELLLTTIDLGTVQEVIDNLEENENKFK